MVDLRRRCCPNCDMADRHYQTMTEALRDALLSDPRSYNEVAQQTGLARTSLMAFAEGRRSLRLDLADKLAAFYGVAVTLPTKE